VEQPQANLVILLRIPFQMMVNELHSRLTKLGYSDSPAAHTIISALLGTEGMRMSELAARTQTTKQVMNYLVNAVEESGYVERVPDPSDGRAKIVRLTASGLKAASDARDILFSIEREWSALYGEQEMGELRAHLERLVSIIGQRAKPAASDDD
jgi:DNA-binding MarR family transcriptional regulator